MLEYFASYVRNKGTEFNGILEELDNIQFYQPKGRPKYSTVLICFALLLRYISCQTYRLLLEQLPLPSLSLTTETGERGNRCYKSYKNGNREWFDV